MLPSATGAPLEGISRRPPKPATERALGGRRANAQERKKRIIYQPTNSFYQVLSAEAYSKHGFNIHGVVFDELHTHPNRKLFDVMTKGSGDARM